MGTVDSLLAQTEQIALMRRLRFATQTAEESAKQAKQERPDLVIVTGSSGFQKTIRSPSEPLQNSLHLIDLALLRDEDSIRPEAKRPDLGISDRSLIAQSPADR